jgi:hypothetical protein
LKEAAPTQASRFLYLDELDSIQEQRETQQKDHDRLTAEIDKLREAQTATDERLNILIDTAHRIVRKRGNGDQSTS